MLCFVLAVLASPSEWSLRLEAETRCFDVSLNVFKASPLHPRVRSATTIADFILMYGWFPSILQALTIIRPQTLIEFITSSSLLHWKSHQQEGSRDERAELSRVIRRMASRTLCGSTASTAGVCQSSLSRSLNPA